MQKLTLIIATACFLSVQTHNAHAVKPESPALKAPSTGKSIPIKKDLLFEWYAPNNNDKAKTKYRLVISDNPKFVGYDQAKNTCNAKCYTKDVQALNFTLSKTHTFLQKEKTFWWQVMAISSDNQRSKLQTNSGVNSFTLVASLAIPQVDTVDVEPQTGAIGSEFMFSAFLTAELRDSDRLEVNYGDGWKVMTGSDTTYHYTTTINNVSKAGEQSYEIHVLDETGNEINSLASNYVIVADEPPVVEEHAPTVTFVSGADSVVKNKSYTLQLKANDDDGNLNRVEVQWGDGSANDSKTATNNAPLTFSHTYKFAGIQPLIATAFDDAEAASEDFTKSINVTDPTPPPVPDVSTINISQSSIVQGNSATFSATLKANLPSGYTVKINYGNGLTKMNGSGTSFNLTATPTSLGSGLFTVGIYDSKNVLKSNQLTGNFSVVEPTPVVIVPPEPEPVVTTSGDVETFVSGSKTFSYTKIANDGSELPKTAKLGTGAKDWACTKDNNTGLIWEVKTTDGGLRDSTKTYTWHDSFNFPTAVNAQGLCGAKDWRLPTIQELGGLLVCSDGKYTTYDGDANARNAIDCTNYGSDTLTRPTINTTYFPDIKDNYRFWSSSPSASNSSLAWGVYFYYGYSVNYYRNDNYFVRLVRG